jgi:hypothetical protein
VYENALNKVLMLRKKLTKDAKDNTSKENENL